MALTWFCACRSSEYKYDHLTNMIISYTQSIWQNTVVVISPSLISLLHYYSYRPFTRFHTILKYLIDNFLENNNLLSPNQTGFRKGFRTTYTIFILNKYLNRRNDKVFVCFVDFEKAFDSVWRQALLFKLLDKASSVTHG